MVMSIGGNKSSSASSTLSALRGNVQRSLVGYYRTKDFIKALRRCRTPSEESALVAKESAKIREALRSSSTTPDHRYHSLGTLVVIHLLGYSALYGQVDFIKLAGNVRKSTGRPRLNHKRLGYLGCAMLLDRKQPTLPLICNTIKHDVQECIAWRDPMVGALAANALGTLAATGTIGRELLPDLLQLLADPSSAQHVGSDLRRRLVAAIARIVISSQRDVDSEDDDSLCEAFVTSTRGTKPVMHTVLETLLTDRSEGSLLAYAQLLVNLLSASRGDTRLVLIEQMRARLLPTLMRVFAGLSASARPEFDLGGVVGNPLLQSLLFTLFGELGREDSVAGDFIANSLLNHDPGKATAGSTDWTLASVGVLMDRCQCLLTVQCPQAAKALAVRQLEELLLGGEHVSDPTLRFAILSRLGSDFARHLPHAVVMQAVRTLGQDLHWPFRQRLIQLAVGSGFSPRDYRQEAQTVLDLYFHHLDTESVSAEGSEDVNQKSAIIVDLVRQLGKLADVDGDWLFKTFLPQVPAKLTAQGNGWTGVSVLCDLLDRHCPHLAGQPSNEGNLFEQALRWWLWGQDVFAEELPSFDSLSGRSPRVLSYALNAVGKWALRHRDRIDGVLGKLQALAADNTLCPVAMVDRVVEVASCLSQVPLVADAEGHKQVDDYTVAYFDGKVLVQRLQRLDGHYEIKVEGDPKKAAGEIVVQWPSEWTKEVAKHKHYIVQHIQEACDDGKEKEGPTENEESRTCIVGFFHRDIAGRQWSRRAARIEAWPSLHAKMPSPVAITKEEN